MYVTVGDYRYDVLSSLNILRFDSTLVKMNHVVLFNPYNVFKKSYSSSEHALGR